MNNIYLFLSIVLFCTLLAYFHVSKILLIAFLFVIFAVVQFKDDFIFRYVATHVASFYLWICEIYNNLLNMYHQSNNSTFPVRKCLDNNGTISSKLVNMRHRITTNVSHNLNSSYALETQSLNYSKSSPVWSSSSNSSPKTSSFHSKSTSRVLVTPNTRQFREDSSGLGVHCTKSVAPLNISTKLISATNKESSLQSMNQSPLNTSSRLSSPILDAKLYANVNSPGFCSRIAERLSEAMTHQPKYDTVGAFPVVNLKSQSPKTKIKTPVRVRLAPPSSDMLFYGTDSMARSPAIETDESMKSVLQVLKDISRKRIHSHVDEEIADNSKRLRISESQNDSESVLHTSLLQQTIQGKRAREESSPSEDDVKKKRKPLQNNEILSSLSSSISIKPPHLKTKKRKAQAIEDPVSVTPVLGKLLKVQTDITPPLSALSPSCPVTLTTEEESKVNTPPSGRSVEDLAPPEERTESQPDPDDGTVSRLLGRMSSQTCQSVQQPISVKKGVFMSTNDLSLSPPKENRLAAMIAVLGGPSEKEIDNAQSHDVIRQERTVKGKALFTSPETPEMSKQNKKVTFSDSLTTTKIYDRDQAFIDKSSSVNGASVISHSTPLSSLTLDITSSPTPTDNKPSIGSQNPNVSQIDNLQFGSSSFSTETKEVLTKIEEPKSAVNTSDSPSTLPTTVSLNSSKPIFSSETSSLQTSVNNVISQNMTSASNTSLSSSDGSKPAFSFEKSTTSVENSKTDIPAQFSNSDLISRKTFTFGNKPDTIQAVSSSSGFTPFLASSSQNLTTESGTVHTVANTKEQSKLTFGLFGNKDTISTSSLNRKEVENKQLVNGFSATSNTNTTSPFGVSNKPLFPSLSTSSTSTSQSAATFSFNSSPFLSSSTTVASLESAGSQVLPQTLLNVTSNNTPSISYQSVQPAVSSFSNASGSSSQTTQPFGTGVQTTVQNTSVFGSGTSQMGGLFKVTQSNAPTQVLSQNSVFGNAITQAVGFGAVVTSQSGGGLKPTSAIQQNIVTNKSNNLFGNLSSNPTSKSSGFVTGTDIPTPQANQIFGLSTVPASSQSSSSPFGSLVNSTAPQSNTLFGNAPTTVQTTSVFGSVSSSTAPANNASFLNSSTTSGQSLVFNSTNENPLTKSMFVSSSTAPPSFGVLNNTQNPSFGNQNVTISTAFGNQNSIKTSPFGNQNNNLTTTQSGFGTKPTLTTSGTFSLGTNSLSASEVKPPPFSVSSPFVFGSSTVNKETVKPFGAATPFSFGSNVQQTNVTMTSSTTQPAMPTFGAPSTSFTASQQPPVFGANKSAPAFSFPQAPSAPGPTFQFNAAAPQSAGGMFSIGSGSTSSRTKTAALRRRHKPT